MSNLIIVGLVIVGIMIYNIIGAIMYHIIDDHTYATAIAVEDDGKLFRKLKMN